MKITALTTLALAAEGNRPWCFVEVETDGGLVGVGEASQSRGDRGVAEQVALLAPLLLGEDPLDLIAALQGRLYRDPFASRIRYAAASAIDQALWDLTGKALGVPCHRMFGGTVRRRVRLYANLSVATPSLAPADLAATARRAVAEGFTAVKIYPLGGEGGRHADPSRVLSRAMLDAALARIEAVRAAIGPDVDLMTDWAWSLAPHDVLRIAPHLAPFDLAWVEEPIGRTDPTLLAGLRGRVPARLAGGEQLYGRRAFWSLLAAEALDVLMPDPKWDGGIGETRAICAMAEARDVEVSLHNMSGPVATAACVQIAAATPNCGVLEYCWGNTPWRRELVGGTEVVEDGHIAVTEAPGLGIAWDREAARRHAIWTADARA